MAKRLQVVFDCGDPGALADFWAEATGYVRQPPPEGFDSWEAWARHMEIPEERWNDADAIIDPEGAGPRIFFQRVPEGKTAKNRVHLDIAQAPRETPQEERGRLRQRESERLQGLGASQVGEYEEMGSAWIVMQDPEGNEFCLV